MEKDKSDKDLNDSSVKLMYFIAAIARLCIGESKKKIMSVSLTHPEVTVIGYIYYENPHPCMSDIGQVLSLDLSTLTRITDRLVEKGLILRKPDLQDRRVVRVCLTQKGKEVVKTLEKERTQILENSLKNLTVEERSNLIKLMEKLFQAIFGKQNQSRFSVETCPH